MLGRTAPLHIYAPKELEEILKMQMDFFCRGLEYEVFFHSVDTTKADVVYEDKSIIIKSIPLDHRINCCGYMFSEKPTLPHIRRDMIDFYNIPECFRSVVPNSRLTSPSAPPRSYVYCSDTKYMPALYKLLVGVDLLYHEATYANDNADRADLYYHSTACQAATVALKAQAKKLVLGHFSARYEDEKMILEEARSIFPNTYLANEMEVFDV